VTRWLSILPLIVLVGLGALFGLYALHRNPHVQPHALVGKPMPDDSLPSLDGAGTVRLRELTQGGPILVNFFASWCAPCQLEAPALMQLKAQGVRIVGIAYEDVPPKGSPQDARAFLARLGDPYARRLTDPDGRVGVDFGVTGVPETYLVGADGMILQKVTGPIEDADAQALARRALTGR
jgi:cytochrome c biogenesis protein CcmG/thiol:disulfide interchange protein DsbE